ncbi:hypothetical protein FHY18_000476 [Xanthomonas arboricola]|uniref:hypothetical protein n=1 Tax=Xanthomonas sp. 3793 TaxID=3035312 RepID=UPI002167BD5E|nr:hypothetical protein [Xanthomonas sp. 3793]MCS3744946.1 hypothetical protein [Xanthomonas sp. 3793]
MTDPTTEEVFAYHKATGCPVMLAKDTLGAMQPLLRERVLLAIQRPKRQGLVDPTQDDPHFAPLISAAAVEARELAQQAGRIGRGSCHFVWREQAGILLERHDIVWFSPKQMNPHIMHD